MGFQSQLLAPSCTMMQLQGLRVGNSAFDNQLVLRGGGRSRVRGPVVVMASTAKVKPRIMRLKKDEIAQVLPWSGSGAQRLQKLGTPATWLARLAISLAGSVAFYNFNTTAAAIASLYWAWDPLFSTAFANSSLRLQYPYAGLWKARVLSVNLVKPQQKLRSDDVFQEIFESQVPVKPYLQLVIGDGSSASLEMKVGVPSKMNQQVRVGETVEVLILSDIKSLSRFMAVRDFYLPDMDLWLSEEPCIERPVFESLIETLRADSSSSALKSRDTQAVKARLPDSVDMLPGTSLGTEPRTARRWRVAELDYEEVPNEFEDDPKLQALRRLGQRQRDGEFSRRVQTSSRMLDFSSDLEDFWEPANDSNEAESSVNDEDYIPVGAFDDEPKLQDRKERELPRSLRADAYGPPMQYMRMQEYGSEVNRREQDVSNKNTVEASAQPKSFEDDDAERADGTVDSEQAEQLTTVGEFLGSGLDKLRTRESEDVELVQEEEV